MNAGAPDGLAVARQRVRQTMRFRRRRGAAPPTAEQLNRQSDVLKCAWRQFGEAEMVIVFFNTRHDQLVGRPLHLALKSAEGLERVEKLLQQS